MRIFLAYKFDHHIEKEDIHRKMAKIKHHYYTSSKVNESQSILDNTGVCIWSEENTSMKWPVHYENRDFHIYTLTPPPNIYHYANKNADVPMIDIENNSNLLRGLSAPFLFSVINKHTEEIKIYIDSMGFSRLYEYRGKNGWFWSNKISALFIFSEEFAEIDYDSWRVYSAAGWFMGDNTPMKYVKRIRPSSIIKIFNNPEYTREIINNGILDSIVSPRNLSQGINFNEVASEIVMNFKNFSKLWGGIKFNVDLSGGKDSRVSAAAIMNIDNLNVKFNTYEDISEEVNVAKRLLSSSNRKYEHEIITPDYYMQKNNYNIIERTMKLLHEHDGDYPPIMIKKDSNTSFSDETIKELKIRGFGGEIASAKYYANKRWIEKLNLQGQNAAFYRLSNFLSILGGIYPENKEKLNQQLFSILNEGENKGIRGLNLLEYFHFMERFRRWVPSSAHINHYSPFLSSSFQRVAFDLNPTQKLDGTLHKNIISRLSPEWNSIPYFKATPEQSREKTRNNTRMWQTDDKEFIEDILRNSSLWDDIFVKDEILELWEEAKKYDIENRKETLFQRIVIKALYNEHIKRINKLILE